MNFSVLHYLSKRSSESSDNLFFQNHEISLSYEEFEDRVRRRAGHLKVNGVKRGERLAIYSDDNLEVLELIFSGWLIGAVIVPMNIKQKADKQLQIEAVIQPDIGVVNSELTTPQRDFKVFNSAYGEAHTNNEELHSEDLALILFTSGSSGIPKGVPIRHQSIYLNSFRTSEVLSLSTSDKLFINTPAYTTSSMLHCFTAMAKGASVVVERGTMIGNNLLDQIRAYGCTGFGGVPVHFTRILASLKNGADIGNLRFLMNSGDHLPVPVIEGIRGLASHLQIFCVYGLTEVAGRLCVLPPDLVEDKVGSVGRPLTGMKVTVRDETQNEVAAGEFGVVYVEGDMLMEGYWNNPEVNAREMTAYGFCTGDIGYFDEDGCLFLQGRNDDIIKVGGEKVSIKMIEQFIIGFSAFKDFMVVVEEDAHIGKVPVLYYVLGEAEQFDKREFLKFAKQKLPDTHIPRKFVPVDEIQRTASGKAIRKSLKH